MPFFLAGTAALVEGTGERVTPAGAIPPWHVLIVKPPVAVSTAEAYRGARSRTSGRQRPRSGSVSIAALEALQRGDFERRRALDAKRFSRRHRFARTPEVAARHRGAARRGRAQRDCSRGLGFVRLYARARCSARIEAIVGNAYGLPGTFEDIRYALCDTPTGPWTVTRSDERRRARRRAVGRRGAAAARRAEQSLRRHRRHDAGRARASRAARVAAIGADRRRRAAGEWATSGSAGGRRLPARRRAHSRQPAQRARGLCARAKPCSSPLRICRCSRPRRSAISSSALRRSRRRRLRLRREARASARAIPRCRTPGRGCATARFAAAAWWRSNRARCRCSSASSNASARRASIRSSWPRSSVGICWRVFAMRPALDRASRSACVAGSSARRCARSSRRIPRPAVNVDRVSDVALARELVRVVGYA